MASGTECSITIHADKTLPDIKSRTRAYMVSLKRKVALEKRFGKERVANLQSRAELELERERNSMIVTNLKDILQTREALQLALKERHAKKV